MKCTTLNITSKILKPGSQIRKTVRFIFASMPNVTSLRTWIHRRDEMNIVLSQTISNEKSNEKRKYFSTFIKIVKNIRLISFPVYTSYFFLFWYQGVENWSSTRTIFTILSSVKVITSKFQIVVMCKIKYLRFYRTTKISIF